MIPLFLWMLSPHFPWQGHGEQEIAASMLFVLASITDGLDGYLARRRGQITTMGMLLDPMADKIMVTAAFVALVAYNPDVVKVWIVVVIIGREFLISGLRSIAASEGFTDHGQRIGQVEDCGADCRGGLGHSRAPLGPLADRHVHDSGVLDTRLPPFTSRRWSADDLGGRLFHRLLEEDRPCVKRPPQGRSAFARQKRENLVDVRLCIFHFFQPLHCPIS